MQAVRSAEEIRDVNTRYHDVAAASYDSKWGIDFGALGQSQVLGKLRKALAPAPHAGAPAPQAAFGRSLEVGAGTGYFSLNLLQAGVVREATCTDISFGMLTRLRDNAQRLGVAVRTARADAEALPFGEASFDLVLGHAVLHHLPNPERAFAEFHRVLAPGGWLLFAGEPSRLGDRLARVPKLAAARLAPIWRAVVGARPAPPVAAPGSMDEHEHSLEHVVDIHAFSPAQLRALAQQAGFEQITVRGEELLANWFGWFNRVLEATANPTDVPALWRQYAFRGYLALQRLDERLLEPLLPAGLFYNLLLSARRP